MMSSRGSLVLFLLLLTPLIGEFMAWYSVIARMEELGLCVWIYWLGHCLVTVFLGFSYSFVFSAVHMIILLCWYFI